MANTKEETSKTEPLERGKKGEERLAENQEEQKGRPAKNQGEGEREASRESRRRGGDSKMLSNLGGALASMRQASERLATNQETNIKTLFLNL